MISHRYAEVAVNVPVQPGRAGIEGEAPRVATFHYHIPPSLDVRPGHLVWVSFGAQQVQGIVVALSDESPVLDTKPILSLADPRPYLSPQHQQLARWLAGYYMCSLADAAFLFLPPGIQQHMQIIAEPVASPPEQTLAALTGPQQAVWQVIRDKNGASLDEIRRETKLPQARAIVDQLLRRGLVNKRQQVSAPHARPKVGRIVTLLADSSAMQAEIDRVNETRLRRGRLLRTLITAGEPLLKGELCERAGCTPADIAALDKEGLLRTERRGPVALAVNDAVAQAEASDLATPSPQGLSGLLLFLVAHPEPIDASELSKVTGCASAQINLLAEKGLVRIEEHELRRDPLAARVFATSTPPVLTHDQQRVYDEIKACLETARCGGREHRRSVLLHGVTGSGKTEIYLRALRDTLDAGRQAIIMVPEIALTPQTIQRFASRFPGRIAVLHSRLSLGEHFDEWRRIRDGVVDIVIGSRSAIFAPLPRLGLIVMDEEHEWTYKQADVPPRYHARDVALKLAELTNSLVILGSATPDIVSYQRALSGEIQLLDMPERVVRAVRMEQGAESREQGVASEEQGAGSRAQGAASDNPSPLGRGQGEGMSRKDEESHESTPAPGTIPGLQANAIAQVPDHLTVIESPLPPVEVIDLRAELRAGNRSIFSRSLHEAMTVALAANQQIILFLNRRGTATFIMCRDCGHVLRCKSCDAPLAYHQAEDDLVCHQCNRRYLVPTVCPQCWSKRIKFFGIGTQKVEEEVHLLFPDARTLRWDRDVTTGKTSHELILGRFIRHEADVLIGTQMIAKGLDLPLVTLVGVISADTALHLPDFRAGERTFQILTQVAGRAGRSALGGRVIIQTYTPEHYAIRAASHHDYKSFADQELTFRAEKGYPPFSQLARLLLQHPNKAKAQAEAERVHQMLDLRIAQRGLPETKLLGPAPCFVSRLRGRYRWQIIVRAPDVHDLLRDVVLPAGWIIDIDPVSLL